MNINLDRIIFIAFVVGAFLGGMRYENVTMNNDALKEKESEHKVEQKQNEAANAVAKEVLDGISNWQKDTKTVFKEMHYETTKTVFLNVCATDEYVRMFNEVQNKSRSSIAGKSDGKVSK